MTDKFQAPENTGFNKRIVRYEEIHDIKKEDFTALINAIDPKPGQVILDGMCGYGAVVKGVLDRGGAITAYLLDESAVQVERAKENLPYLPLESFVTKSIIHSGFSSDFFDTVAIKMGIHEVPKSDQPKILSEVMRILKPGGKFVVWDIMLPDETGQMLFQDIIRKKDELAGFVRLTQQRYFFTEQEFLENVNNAGFAIKGGPHIISYRFSSEKRLESELQNNNLLLDELNEYIRVRFPDNLKQTMQYSDSGTDIQFNICKKVFTMVKRK